MNSSQVDNTKGFFGKLLDTAKGHLNTAQDHFQKITAPPAKKNANINHSNDLPGLRSPQTDPISSNTNLPTNTINGGSKRTKHTKRTKRTKRKMQKKQGSNKYTKHSRKSPSKKTRNGRSKKTRCKR